MYVASNFDEARLDVLHALISDHPLGTLVTTAPGGLCADHIPFEIGAPTPEAPFGVLRAHVARANPLWQLAGMPVLAVFQGPSGYVSPAFYEEKAISGKVVPTWDYAVVHAHGTLRAIEDPAWLLALLERLTTTHEATRARPWAVRDAPPEYVDKLLRAIVGIEIPIARVQGKWKLSQNRSLQDQHNIATGLAGSAMAALIAQRAGLS
jgi:transcriptional regulator